MNAQTTRVPPFSGGDIKSASSPFKVRGDKRVLLVDDEAAVRQLIAEALTDEGYSVAEAAHAAPALEILRAERFDLLITDLGLPHGMTGRELAAAALILQPVLKIIAITGYADQVPRSGQMDADGFDVLQKPFALDLLCAYVAARLT